MMNPQHARAIHVIDEEWTKLIDEIRADSGASSRQLMTLANWRKEAPDKINGPTMRRVLHLAWLALSDATLRSLDNQGESECVSS